MAAFTSGADWSFPADLPHAADLPGGWKQEPEHESTTSTHSPSQAEPEPESTAYEHPPKRRRTHYPPRNCRICLEEVQPTFHYDTESTLPAALQPPPKVTYESEDGGRLLSPCKCKGSQKYVHEGCLDAWRKADPNQKRNYWECPTCRYRYKLQRLTWSSWISSTAAQIGLTLFIFLTAIFVLGFVADPIINMYLDPVSTIATVGGPRGSLIFEDEPATWTEHIVKGLASLGLLGFAKFMLTLSPFQWFNVRTGGIMGGGRSTVGGTGRDRLQQLSWITIIIGIVTFLYAVWKGVRAWSRRTLQNAGERVLDVPGGDDEDDEESAS
ncbi:uncharacterized protein MYCFIDRAFT_210182 [Pseudocercospora fijiensis CIRAD86]|uniref:RING-CH-type domain-containing protein n=1 Tax=Pseudocercospora fijiensis (strain CIRAD86) TaxID=383855 RepID=N1QCY1_PSEFD|nr:uncharacterized protein MYCFIDRAFT_210182 [Pseudocercospora fijiensis CIRAD86]EME89777.1 hypothetical protein MYCFIDRAFT_210182 [Pseudocercospora fijiensis CIRAD86]